jgi:hypothetical protein
MSVIASQATVSEDLAGIRSAAERFLHALDDLDWEPFRTSWASTPTIRLRRRKRRAAERDR